MMRSLSIFAAMLATVSVSTSAQAAKDARPNVIIFLVDDMGWMDSTPYGSKYYVTPQMERLAQRSMRFTDAYACPLCSPTRASIMSGQYNARHGITTASGHQAPQPVGHKFLADSGPAKDPLIHPESKNYLEPSQYTLAEALGDAGWQTAHFGKWHLGLTEEYWPEQQGFQIALHGKPDPGPASYFSPGYYRTKQTFPDGPPGEYITDRLTDEAIRYIEAHRDAPFFVNLWHHSVHGPWGFKKEYADKFVGRKDPRGAQGNPIMAAMLQSVDESLGRILDKLDELKLADNTIFIFMSDNGGNTHSNTSEDGKKGRIKPGTVQAELRENWARYAGDQPPTNNAPLRSGKGWLYEGGVRVPLMVAWPGRIKPGSQSSAVVGAIDVYPTVLDLCSVPANPSQKIDGLSIKPVLEQTGPLKRDAYFNFFPHGQGLKPAGVTVRSGDWKLIRWFDTSSTFPDVHELYNLRDDLGESKNLASAMPEKVKELDAAIDRFLADTHALVPKPNPAYRSPAKTTDPALARYDGWVVKGGKAEMKDGALTFTAEGRQAFLAINSLRQPGPATVRLRTRGAGGGGKIQWRTSDQEEFPSSGQIVEFKLPASDDFADASVELPVKGSLAHIRLYLPAQSKPITVDAIEMSSPSSSKRRWDFNAP